MDSTLLHITHSYTHIIGPFAWFCCIQCAQIMRVILGPQARCGTALLAAAVCTSAWTMALWWLWILIALLSLHHCVRERESMYWMWWKKEPAAQRRSVVSEFKPETWLPSPTYVPNIIFKECIQPSFCH